MRIRPNNNNFASIILLGGLIIIAPLFAQPLIDMTDGICSHRFINSAKEAAKAYYEELGVPEDLSVMIDSTYANRDQISAVFYVFIAHMEKGLEDTYRADLARIIATNDCYYIPESLFNAHLKANPEDYIAAGDYALLLAKRGAFDEAEVVLEKILSDASPEAKRQTYENLGIVYTMKYLEDGRSRTREDAFEAFRIARTGDDDPPNDFTAAKLWLNIEKAYTEGNWRHNYTVRIGHLLGSDAIVLSIKSTVVFGREIETSVSLADLKEIRDLFGSIYIAPGETLTSRPGALQITADMGTFSPFYEGEASFQAQALYPGGGKNEFFADSTISLVTQKSLAPYYDALAYGEYEYAESVLTAISRSPGGQKKLPLRWKASVELSRIMEDSTLWDYGLEYIDSLLNEEIDPNLWVYKGALLYNLGRPEEAKEQLDKAILADPRNFWAIYDLALVEYELGNKEQAAELFCQTREINTRMYLGELLAGVIYEELGLYGKALMRYNMALRNMAFRNREIEQWIEDLEKEIEDK